MTVANVTAEVSSLPRRSCADPSVSVDASGRTVRGDVAAHLDRWRTRNRFYHDRRDAYVRFLVPEGESVLLIGCEDGALLSLLKPSRGVGVDRSPEMIRLARRHHPDHDYHVGEVCDPSLAQTFEYIVLNDVTGESPDLFTLFQRLADFCTPTTRLIVVQHNYLWRPVLHLAARLRLKRPEVRQNWFSSGDLRVVLEGTGFETINVQSKLFCPINPLGVGRAINFLAGLTPFVYRLASTEIVVARRAVREVDPATRTASIVLTTRDERDNIEPILRAIPDVGADTEIIFVEGHSTDGTREEIRRVIEAYPQRKIRLLVQEGVGQGDAIRKGFTKATGDVIILLEADRTSPPEDVLKAFEIVATGRAEYVNGTRFIYPRDRGAMPRRNVIGNWLFAVWFTWFLGQRTSDVLCGIKAIDRRWFRRLERQWGFLGLFDPFGDFELLFGAARLGLKICEVPTRYHCRPYGRPKSRFFTHGLMLGRMARRATAVFKCR